LLLEKVDSLYNLNYIEIIVQKVLNF
jgi:hypothetical protein